MYKIEQKEYGYHITLEGLIKLEEMERWYQESLILLENAPKEFGVFVDMRSLKPIPPESIPKMEEVQKHYKMKGMTRSVVILNTAITTMQFKRIAKETGIYEWERYLDASKIDDWENIGIKWLTDQIDPDQ